MKKTYSDEKYPLLSFITPVYKDAHTIEELADSIVSQDYPNIELILSVDGCKESEAVVRRIEKKYAKLNRRVVGVYSKKNRGACVARNEGAKIAKGKYFSFLPADAKLFPGVARVWMTTLMEHPDYDFVYGGYRFREERKTFQELGPYAKDANVSIEEYAKHFKQDAEGKFMLRESMDYLSEPFDPYLLDVTNYIDGSFPLKAEKFWEVGGWDPNIKSLQDWDLWLSIVKKGGKGIYISDIFFDTEYPHPGGLSADSAAHWLERTRAIKAKHVIPDRKICVSSLGAPFHGKRIARLLDADYKDMPSFKPHAYDLVYLIGFFPTMADLHGAVFRNAVGAKAIHWIGSDIWQMQQMDLRSRTILLNFFASNHIQHLCEADFTQAELKKLDIDAKIIPIPPRFFYEANPLPKKFTVAVYMPATNASFYLPEKCKEIADLLPDVEFKFFGDQNMTGQVNNIEYLGYVNDMQKVIDQSSMILRLTIHDGLPLSVIEFLSAGRRAITSCPMEGTEHAPVLDVELIVRKIKEIRKVMKDEGIDYDAMMKTRKLYDPKKYVKAITDLALYEPQKYWENRARAWAYQSKTAYTLKPDERSALEKFLRKSEKKVGNFSSVIDLGCGDGRMAYLFEGKEYLGIDIAKALVTEAKKEHPDLTFSVNTVEKFVAKKKFDLAFSFTTLEHIKKEDWMNAVKNLRKIARFGVFVEPMNFESIGPCHDHPYEKDFHVLKKEQFGNKWIFLVDLSK